MNSILEKALLDFGIMARVIGTIKSPSVTMYKLKIEDGIKLSKIRSLSEDLALKLASSSIRIIAPIPNETCIGIEIPNEIREVVSFKDMIESDEFKNSKYNIPICLGKDIYGKTIVEDLYAMPHLLIAGSTGSGKSVCVNGIIASMLSKSPKDLRLILIDPKMVELSPYNNISHLIKPVITDSEEAIKALRFLVDEMESRYRLLEKAGVRDISEYRKSNEMPFIVLVIDEFADLMVTSRKETESLIARLAAKARAVGILLILATQRPSTDVITGLIKANIPARIAFRVTSVINSRIILDQKGAEQLLGQGDMLYSSGFEPIRIQGCFITKQEVDDLVSPLKVGFTPIKEEKEDPLLKEALLITRPDTTASDLQRFFKIGHTRAVKLLEKIRR